jgi:hypothetical protein
MPSPSPSPRKFRNEQERYQAQLNETAALLTVLMFVVPLGLFTAMLALSTVVPLGVAVPTALSVLSFYGAGIAFYLGSGEWLALLFRAGVVAAILAGAWAYMPPGEAIARIF